MYTLEIKAGTNWAIAGYVTTQCAADDWLRTSVAQNPSGSYRITYGPSTPTQ